MKILVALALYILGSFGLGVAAATVRYASSADSAAVWPGIVVAYGLGTTAFFIGVLFTIIGFFAVLVAVGRSFPEILEAIGQEGLEDNPSTGGRAET